MPSFRSELLQAAACSLNNRWAIGHDGIPVEVIKHIAISRANRMQCQKLENILLFIAQTNIRLQELNTFSYTTTVQIFKVEQFQFLVFLC